MVLEKEFWLPDFLLSVLQIAVAVLVQKMTLGVFSRINFFFFLLIHTRREEEKLNISLFTQQYTTHCTHAHANTNNKI